MGGGMMPDQDTPTHGPWKRLTPIARTPCDRHPEAVAVAIRSRMLRGVDVVPHFEAGCALCSGFSPDGEAAAVEVDAELQELIDEIEAHARAIKERGKK